MVTIPGPRENDADDVSLALEVAQSQWTRGDFAEALKWLKKAVDAAFEAEDDARGMELSKVAAEAKAQAAKPAKPQIPPPRSGGAVPLNSSMPPPPQPRPKPAEGRLDRTGTRRTSTSARASSKAKGSKRRPMEEDEATREYKLADVGIEDQPSSAAVADEWPTETLDGLDELEEAPEQTASRPVRKSRSKSSSKSTKAKPKKRESAKSNRTKPAVDKPTAAKPAVDKPTVDRTKRQKPTSTVPTTHAIRVAVGKDKGTVRVRLLDSQGLRSGEHDAMLVALVGDDDIRKLFA